VCSRCHKEKLLSPREFLLEPGSPEGYAEVCVDCMSAEARLQLAADGADDVADNGNTSEGEDMAGKTKVCTRCRKRSKVEAFHKDKSKRDGLDSWCKDCGREYNREYVARKKAEASK
jgi:hypothetical protein